MHSLIFNLKRAHHQSLGFLRTAMKPFAFEKITPARFDFLYAIYTHEHREAFMADVRMGLGCVKSNISRYVKLAIDESWITIDWDGRTLLCLTEKAIRLVERVLHALQEVVDANVALCVEGSEAHASKAPTSHTSGCAKSDSSHTSSRAHGDSSYGTKPNERDVTLPTAPVAPRADGAGVGADDFLRIHKVQRDDRDLAFEHTHRMMYDDPNFLRHRSEARAQVRNATRTRISFELLQGALWRVRAVFSDVRLLDIYAPSFETSVDLFGLLNHHYTEDGWLAFRLPRYEYEPPKGTANAAKKVKRSRAVSSGS